MSQRFLLLACLGLWPVYIAAGDARTERPSAKHWAFLPPQRPDVPGVRDLQWSVNPIDAFIAAEHDRHAIRPVGAAEKHVLLRRVYLDLVGLPPTPDEVRAFANDAAPDAYERVVERLLASPHYGERWGRHWMDVWRYSDWAGYGQEIRQSQRHIWRWRDWIIESLNADKPYDRMIVEMLAGDELAPDDPETVRATGFLARSWFKFNRNVWLDNVVEHTSKAFLGVTLNCARCHEHKYDPIEQADYYRFRAFFEPHSVRTDRVPGQIDLMQDGLPRVFDAEVNAPTYMFARGDEAQPIKDLPLAPGVPAALGASELLAIQPISLPPTASYPALRPHVQREAIAAAEGDLFKARKSLDDANRAVADAKLQLVKIRDSDLAAAAAPPRVFLADSFAAARPDVWQTGPGKWNYEGGRLRQEQVGDGECWLRTTESHPQDFVATFRFKTTGGQQWRSVGLSFDLADGRYDGVYLSGYAGGPKLQVYHSTGGSNEYPPAAAKPLEVMLDREYILRVDVQGRLVNVSVNGALQLAYRLPRDRAPGRFAVWTYDAAAEFLEAKVTELPADAKLVPDPATPNASPVVANATDAELAVDRAKQAAALATTQLRASEAHLAAVVARVAADNARFANPPDARAGELAGQAAVAERRAVARGAEESVQRNEQAYAAAQRAVKPDDAKAKEAVAAAEKKLNEARTQLKSALDALAKTDAQYTPLGELYPQTSTGRRLALARWIASPRNPLSARVAINHTWMRHFGRPLVPTVFDFGSAGQPPSHPELLDWLAAEFIESGWSMKSLHRLMVTSSTYRLASSISDQQSSIGNQPAVDPENIYFWRQNPRRMEAEVVRDSVLHVAGRLDAVLGGPDIDHSLGMTSARRSVYFRTAFEKQMTFLTQFDVASVNECYRRSESVVPQQALALANSGMSLSQSRWLARDLARDTGDPARPGSDAAFVAAAFEYVLGRPPSDAERSECLQFLAAQTELLRNPTGLTSVTTGSAAELKPAADPAQRARENLVHVLFNHNEFVTIR
jgi:hypothetical protein